MANEKDWRDAEDESMDPRQTNGDVSQEDAEAMQEDLASDNGQPHIERETEFGERIGEPSEVRSEEDYEAADSLEDDDTEYRY